MTVYARSDVAAVSISTDHGGCGTSHSRPAPGGEPVKLWSLTCHDGCEDYLRSDPLWSSTISGIPETADERSIREDAERRGMVEQQQSTAQALEQLAKLGDLPSIMGQFMSFLTSQHVLPAADVSQLCPNGHPNASTARFCVDCGSSTTAPVPHSRGSELPPVEPDVITDGDDAPVPPPIDLDALGFSELQTLAGEVGVDKVRSKREQLMLLKAHYGLN